MAEAPETPAEAKARRRRWLTLAEIATVVTLVISAATFWDNHQQREEERAEKAAAAKPVVAPLLLTAKPEDEGSRLVLTANRDRIIQSQTISFPTALDVSPVDIVGNARIEADWFAGGLRDALGDKRVRGRVPVAHRHHLQSTMAPNAPTPRSTTSAMTGARACWPATCRCWKASRWSAAAARMCRPGSMRAGQSCIRLEPAKRLEGPRQATALAAPSIAPQVSLTPPSGAASFPASSAACRASAWRGGR